MTITKANLVEKISNRLGLSKADSQNLVENFFEILSKSLESGEDVQISGFGTFKLKKKNTRPGRNPMTGEVIPVTARTIVKFSASSKFKTMVHD